ncbi:hypothetical protein Tco_0785701 [Tanacetum coccineum]
MALNVERKKNKLKHINHLEQYGQLRGKRLAVHDQLLDVSFLQVSTCGGSQGHALMVVPPTLQSFIILKFSRELWCSAILGRYLLFSISQRLFHQLPARLSSFDSTTAK